ncbi:MAG TPA: ABC transporter ATP-binding protein [Lacipirellulaceae bacterium]|nr:ABC transporter ATP-binding protein [Lacipirellulaceae bacterium]
MATSSPAVNRPEDAPDAVVRVAGLTKIFKDFWGRPKARAVDNVSFEVRRGEVFGLLGPNGSGKSTTVKMLLGLLHPTRGLIEVFGKNPRHVQTKARIGYLPEESYLYRYLDSRETLDFFGNLFRLPADKRDDRTEQLLEMVGLKNVQRRVVGEFSKGMQRRIGLAQALINDPDLVILDEPTSGLDPLGCREVKDLILALARRGKTVILSSHLLADVQDVCDRIAILHQGELKELGRVDQLLRVADVTQIRARNLSADCQNEIRSVIERHQGELVELGNPTTTLEELFLEIVRDSEARPGRRAGVQ